jgi:D-alanyl-D-alanine carboxypeptidase
VVVGLSVLTVFVPPSRAADPFVTARAAIIVDAATGEAVWEKNADAPLPPASTTKILTAILAIESGRLDERLPVSVEASEVAPSKIGLRPGERMELRDLLYAVLLNSANDAATVVAEGIAGSESAFAVRMNAKAASLGARNSHFVNPHGLTADGHVSSARDLAKIFRYGLQLDTFREILETPRIRVPLESRRLEFVSLHSHNRLLEGWTHRVIGKTGFTRPAGRCFVGAANADGHEVIIALLGSRDLWGDSRRLFAHAFDEPAGVPAVLTASATRHHGHGSRAPVVTTEGDEDLTTRFRRSGVHLASAGRPGAQAESTGDVAERYTVRLGPYSSHREATKAQRGLATKGYRARVVGQALLLGDFSSRNRADRLAKNLQLKGYHPTIVAAR